MTDRRGQLILVCGAARSGTTMLDLMLGNADNAFSCGEIYALFRPFRNHHFDPVCTCGERDCAAWQTLRRVPEADFHKAVLEQPGIDYAVDSSKDLRWVLDSNEWARGHDIPVRNVLIWKDPIDLAHSHWKRGRPVDYFRKQFLDYYERFLDLGLPFISVSYQRLVNEPEKVLGALCAELGIGYFPGKEEFWHKHHHHFFGSAGTAKQVGAGRSKVGLRRDFPQEFTAAWEAYQSHAGPDERLARVVNALEQHDVCSPATIAQPTPRGGLRPLWYYRHMLKAFVRRYFPERAGVIE